jgi:hypothetical protein
VPNMAETSSVRRLRLTGWFTSGFSVNPEKPNENHGLLIPPIRTLHGVLCLALRLVLGVAIWLLGSQTKKRPPRGYPRRRIRISVVGLGFDRVTSLPVLSLSEGDRQAQLFTDRAGKEPA